VDRGDGPQTWRITENISNKQFQELPGMYSFRYYYNNEIKGDIAYMGKREMCISFSMKT
jgi:hypothetical protein